MSHKAKLLIKYAMLLLNIVDSPFDDTCWLAKLIKYVIMGGLLIPIIYMWWKLSLLNSWVMVGYFLILIKLQLFHVFMLLVPFVSSLLAFALFLHIIMQVFFPSHHCCASFYVAITCLCAIFCFCVGIVFYFHTIIYVHVVVSCLCIIVAHIV